jgi:DNA replicative helicase MCM subunit Mcm2 (Cdc46/Mcm family)
MTDFVKGDKAIVRRTRTVTIVKAMWSYYCEKCGRHIRPKTLYGRNYREEVYCIKCCEKR